MKMKRRGKQIVFERLKYDRFCNILQEMSAANKRYTTLINIIQQK